MRSVAILSGILFVLPGALAAQQQAPPEIVRDDRLAVLEQRVRALEDELSLLKEALKAARAPMVAQIRESQAAPPRLLLASAAARVAEAEATPPAAGLSSTPEPVDRKSTRLNSSHLGISYAVFCLKKKIRTIAK